MSEQKDPAYPPDHSYPSQPSAPYPQQQGYPPQGGYPSQPVYTQQQGYAAPPVYPQQPQGYTTQTYVPQAVYTPQGQVTIKTGAPQHSAMVRETQAVPNDYLCFSIFVMLFCCLPFGIIALIKSMDVRSLVALQDMAAATRASQSAKNWNIAGLVTGLIVEVITIIILIIWFVIFGNTAASIYDSVNFASYDYYG